MIRSPLLVLLSCLAACGSGNSPIDRRVGEGRIVRQVGPGGAVLRGDGGTELQGFLLEIPEGALTRLVDIVVEPGSAIDIPDSSAVSVPFAIRVRPDPGVLLRPAILSVGLDLPQSRRPEDLFVASRASDERPTILSQATPRYGVVADFGSYDPDARVFAAPIRTLSELQVRLADRRRLTDDAFRLVQLGYESLARLTDAGLLEADRLFGEAQRADPFAGSPNLFRALTRVLVVLDGREDSGPGLDSVGEALERLGFSTSGQSLLGRLRTGTWPSRIGVPAGAPTASEILELLRIRLRPAIELAIADLDRVPATTGLVLSLPAAIPALSGDRELDATDVLLFRALLSGTAFAIDHLADFDLDLDASRLSPPGGEALTVGETLAAYPALGALIRAPDETTFTALKAFLLQVQEAFDALDGEEDDQSDDLLVFPPSLGEEERDEWRLNLAAVRASLEDDTEQRIAMQSRVGSLVVRLGGPWRAGGFSPRALAPQLFRVLPIAGTLPDPTAGGLLPAMTQDRATELVGAVDLHDAPRLAIVADGSFADWTADALALSPSDPVGDAFSDSLRAVDIRDVWFAENDESLAFRISVADGALGYRRDQASVYGMRFRSVGENSLGPSSWIEVYPVPTGFEVRVIRDGVPRSVRAAVGVRGSDLEVTLDRFDLLDPDEPVADRAVDAFAQVLALESAGGARDQTRAFVVRF